MNGNCSIQAGARQARYQSFGHGGYAQQGFTGGGFNNYVPAQQQQQQQAS